MKRISKFLILACALTLSGCNGDIFLDEADVPEVENLTIEGDGGEATFNVSMKDLEHFGFDLMSSSMKYCNYYNAAGDVIDPSSPASEVSRIVFETNFTKLELSRVGSKFTVRSICQTFRNPSHWTIRLEYGYGVRFIDLEILPGQAIQLTKVIYNNDWVIEDRAKVSTFRDGYTNDGPLPQSFTIFPYINELASILVEPESYESWTKGQYFTMPVPKYVNGEWKIEMVDGIRPDSKYTYEGPDRFTKIDIEVPEYSSVNIFTEVIYTGVKVSGEMVFRNEILDKTFTEKIKVTSLYPVNHEIRIEDAK